MFFLCFPYALQVNGVSITQVGVAHKSLGSLDEATAFDLVSKDDHFLKEFSNHTIRGKRFMTDHLSKASIGMGC